MSWQFVLSFTFLRVLVVHCSYLLAFLLVAVGMMGCLFVWRCGRIHHSWRAPTAAIQVGFSFGVACKDQEKSGGV